MEEGNAYQTTVFCDGLGSWAAYGVTHCGAECRPAEANVIEFPRGCSGRMETTCVAEGAGTYQALPTSQSWVDAIFARIAETCLLGDVFGNRLQLELIDGCPVRLSMSSLANPTALACLESALGAKRWDCARSLACVSFFETPL